MVADLCSGEPVDVADTVEHTLSLNDLPDELLIIIFNRLLDLKCLCSCSLVSPRFSSLILLHVHTVSFTVSRPTPQLDTLAIKLYRLFRQFVFATDRKPLPPMISSFYSESFGSAGYFLSKFKSIRSLHLILPPYPDNPNPIKWTAKFGPSIDTLVFLFASSIRDGNVDQEEEEDYSELTANELRISRVLLAYLYIHAAIVWHRMLLFIIEEHPLLQDITITDSMNQGYLSLRGSKLAEMRHWIKSELKKTEAHGDVDSKNQGNLSLRDSKLEWIRSAHLKMNWVLNQKTEILVSLEHWHVPMLKLPVSGKVMTSATLVLMEMVDHRHLRRELDSDAAAIANLFGKGEEEFGEAIVELMVKHESKMEMFQLN